jgi:hypothetical protein
MMMGMEVKRDSMYRLKQNGLAPKNVDSPESGFYEMKDGDRWAAVAIWFGPPNDPETGEELDRSYRWQARRNGQEADPWELWPYVCARPISQEQYLELLKERIDE